MHVLHGRINEWTYLNSDLAVAVTVFFKEIEQQNKLEVDNII